MDFLLGGWLNGIVLYYILRWIYRNYIKDNNNEFSNSINSIIDSIKKEYKKIFKSDKDTNYKSTTQEIFDEEDERRKNESYENALTLYKAGVITKEELREFRN